MREIEYNKNLFRAFTKASLNQLISEKSKKIFESICKSNSCNLYIDCGSAVGAEALPYRSKFSEIHCFEPTQQQFELLKHNTSFYDNIKIHNVALSNYKGKSKFFVYSHNYQSSQLALHKKRPLRCEEQIVQVTTLDSFAFENIDFIKIDVESNEKEMLLGALKTLEKNNPVIRIEITKNADEVLHILRWLNFVPIFFDCDGISYQIDDDLSFTVVDDMLLWSSNNVTLNWSLHKKEAQRKIEFPKNMNPCWGDFWFIKREV